MDWSCGRFSIQNVAADVRRLISIRNAGRGIQNQLRASLPWLLPEHKMHIVLLEPEIPPNTGNVARLCAATNSTLHLIEPFGFTLDDTQLKRAGMDYWQHVQWHRWPDWAAF